MSLPEQIKSINFWKRRNLIKLAKLVDIIYVV